MAKLGVRLNISNGGLSQVAGWEFNSVAELADKLIGCSSEGISELTGDSDNAVNIDAYIKLPLSDFTLKHPKRIRRGYISYETNGKLKITCITNENKYFTSWLPLNTGYKEASVIFPGNRKFVGATWEFEIINVDGADFSLDYLGILFIPLTRSRGL